MDETSTDPQDRCPGRSSGFPHPIHRGERRVAVDQHCGSTHSESSHQCVPQDPTGGGDIQVAITWLEFGMECEHLQQLEKGTAVTVYDSDRKSTRLNSS